MSKLSQWFPLFIFVLILASCQDDDFDFVTETDVAEFLNSDYTIELNPYGNNPLAAKISFETSTDVTISAKVLGDYEMTTDGNEPATEHSYNIIGLYPNSANQVVLTYTSSDDRFARDTVDIQTQALPDYLPTIDIVEREARSNALTLAEFSLGNNGVFQTQPFMVDPFGEIRWYLDLTSLGGWASPFKRLANGNLLFARNEAIYEYSWAGEELNRWDIPGYYQHHEILERENGNFIVAVDKLGIGTVEDHMIEVDRSTSEIVKEWDLRQILDVDRFDLFEDPNDWFHMNAIAFDESDQSLIVSGRHQGVVKISYDNELIWILSPHKGWGNAGIDGMGYETSAFLLTAVNSEGTPYPQSIQDGDEETDDFNWVWGQHAPMILENGNIFIYDNGFNRRFTGDVQYSRGVEYAIDEEQLTVQEVWQYGRERGADFFSPIISDVDVNQAGNRVITSGIIATPEGPQSIITEVDRSKNVIYEVKLNFKNQFSNGTFSWGNLDLCYRSEQIQF